ncbi:PAS domain-containing protein [Hymenobacter sp. B81]|uniref:PAS domain-containing protein n=1 Tax=Hymenobacter sp. B81 TaxID=3344878 RepID=UPI0037DC9A59
MPDLPSAADFELVFNELSAPHLLLNADLVIIAVNEAGCRALNRSRPELLGQPAAEALAPWLPALTAAQSQQWSAQPARAGEAAVRPLPAAGGARRYLLRLPEETTPAPNGTPPQPETAAGPQGHLFPDVGQDRRLLEQLDQLPLHLVVLHGPGHVVQYVSARARPYVSASALGQPAARTQPGPGPALLARLDEVYRTGQVRRIASVPVLALGAEAPDARLLNVTLQPLLTAGGQIEGVLLAGLDVTDQLLHRRLAAEAVAETQRQQEQFRFLTEFIPQLLWTTDAAGRLRYGNQRWTEYTGLAANTGADLWPAHVHPHDLDRVQQLWQQALATGQPFTAEFRLREAGTGLYHWFLTQALPQVDANGRVRQWFGACTDVDESRRSQQRLEDKDRLLQQILSQVPAHLCTLLGPEHICGFATPALLDLFGGRLRVGWPLGETVAEVAEQGLLALLDEVFTTGQTVMREEYPLRVQGDAPGASRYLDFTLQALRDEQQRTQGILVFAVEVTDKVLARRQSEVLTQEVRRRDEQFQVMVEALPNIMYISAASGQLEYLSPQWYAYTGQPAAAALNQTWLQAIHPDDQQLSRESFQQNLQAGLPWAGELRLRRHDGQYRWHLSRAVPLRNPAGQVQRWYGATVDMHEQRELREQLQRREAEFRLLAESIPQLVWVLDAQGRPVYSNRRWRDFAGYDLTAPDAPADPAELVHPDDREPARLALAAAMAAAGSCTVEYRLREGRTGLYRWFMSQAVPLLDADGRAVQWFGTCTDIHEQKELTTALASQNDELRRVNQDLDGFVYTASHDLKQPLDNMAGIFGELARTAQFRDPEAAQLTAMFERSLQQIYATIHDLTSLVQVQRNQQQVSPETVELASLWQQVLTSVQEQVLASGATVEADFATVPTVQFVRPNLQSVLYNLLSNALRYADPQRPPRVRVWTELHHGQPVLSVQDNGLGIDLERYGPQLFQMFRRFHYHTEGSGMGLYLVQRIVQSHGGRLEVQSTVGVGTTFRIWLQA